MGETQLTYKSITTILDELCDKAQFGGPKLVPVLPLEPDVDQSDIREMLMPPALLAEISKNDPKKTMDYNANVRAFLLRFVLGVEVDNDTYMKSWRDNVFELRVQLRKKKESLRIFGAFAKPDSFVALVSKPRAYFGDGSDPRWDEIIEKTIASWNTLFPACHRVVARPFSNCVTANYYDVHQGAKP
jgi:hypothetical protein